MIKIINPTLLIDEKKVKANIKRMAEKALSLGLNFRPHFKTHQSKQIGHWFKDYSINGITVSSLKMAEYFAEDGWESITIAFPVNILDMEQLNKLASKIDLRVLAVHPDVLQTLDNNLSNSLSIYIEIDPGYGRSGVSHSDDETIKQMMRVIKDAENLNLSGFYIHSGHTYKARGKSEITSTAEPVLEIISELKAKYSIPVCFGDTPSCSILEDFGEVDELSPGNFVFYDWIQTQIGSCSFDQIAVAMACPVVAKYESRNEILIHGGAVHFSKDSDLKDGEEYFGVVCRLNDNGWSDPIPDCYLKSVSQEHGIISCSDEFFSEISVGDPIAVIPIHSCLTADLMGGYTTLDGVQTDHLSKNYK